MENIVVAVAEGTIPKDLLQRVVVSLIEDDDFPDDLKLDLVEAMGQGQAGDDAGDA
jgi:death-on-curing protein